MKSIPLLLVLIVSALHFSLNAQVANYSFSQTISNYGASNTGSIIGTIQQNDDLNLVPLPFPFVYNSTTYTAVNVCSNGYLSFNNVSTTAFTPIADNSTSELISPFGQDLFMGTIIFGDLTAGSNTISNVSSTLGLNVGDQIFDYGIDFGGISPTVTAISGNSIVLNINSTNNQLGYDILFLNGSIRQNVSGMSPNRILEIQFNNLCTLTSIYNEIVNFKVKLYETTNKIEFLYGFMSPGVLSGMAQVGLKGNSISDFNARKISTTDVWSASTPASLISDFCVFTNTLFPANGLSYLWSPPTCTTPSLMIIQSPTFVCAGNSVTLTPIGSTTYTWSTGITGTQLVISPSVTSNYAVSAGSLTCITTKTISVNVSNCTGLDQSESAEDEIMIFPNPFDQKLTFRNILGSPAQIEITNPAGDLIYLGQVSGDGTFTLNTSTYSSGIYFFSLTSENFLFKKKIIKQ